jgi:hypothetical protein
MSFSGDLKCGKTINEETKFDPLSIHLMLQVMTNKKAIHWTEGICLF